MAVERVQISLGGLERPVAAIVGYISPHGFDRNFHFDLTARDTESYLEALDEKRVMLCDDEPGSKRDIGKVICTPDALLNSLDEILGVKQLSNLPEETVRGALYPVQGIGEIIHETAPQKVKLIYLIGTIQDGNVIMGSEGAIYYRQNLYCVIGQGQNPLSDALRAQEIVGSKAICQPYFEFIVRRYFKMPSVIDSVRLFPEATQLNTAGANDGNPKGTEHDGFRGTERVIDLPEDLDLELEEDLEVEPLELDR
ncbi:MAG: hypothetical protein ABIH82_00570 [Candidatus Woesearchaeota archaeon]